MKLPEFKTPSSGPVNGVLVGGAVMAGYWVYGWRGLVLAVTLIAFWLVLQFNQATRVLRHAGQRPKGEVDSVVMLQSRLEPGLTMLEVLKLTGSLGIQVGQRDEWDWQDAGDNLLRLVFRRGVLIRWELARAPDPEEAEAAEEAKAPDAVTGADRLADPSSKALPDAAPERPSDRASG
ncbi:MAG: hypothetical protein AB9M60_24520 [Leptothrix sp. (in: b-proteobacteria)]